MTQINESWLWHRRLCHINFDSLVRISLVQVVRDLPKITKPINAISVRNIKLESKKEEVSKSRINLLLDYWNWCIHIFVVLPR